MEQEFRPHPVLINYEASRGGIVRNRRLKKPVGTVNNMGYLCFGAGGKIYYKHRIIYEAFNGLIKDGLVIDHVDSDPLNNSLENLQAISQRENIKRGRTGENSKHPRPVISFDTLTHEKRVFQSIDAAGKYFGICMASVRKVAEGIYKTALSKKNGNRIKFSYSQKNLVSKILNNIHVNYKNTPYYKNYYHDLSNIFLKEYIKLSLLNKELILFFCKILNIKTKISSDLELSINTKKIEYLKDISLKKNATTYILEQVKIFFKEIRVDIPTLIESYFPYSQSIVNKEFNQISIDYFYDNLFYDLGEKEEDRDENGKLKIKVK